MKVYRKRIERDWRNIIKISLLIGGISALANIWVNLYSIPAGEMRGYIVSALLGGMISFLLGFCNPFVLISMEKFLLQSKRIKSMPFFTVILIRIGLYLLTGTILYVIIGLLFFPQNLSSIKSILFTLLCILFFSLTTSTINFFSQFLGTSFLRSYLSSKYHQAKIQSVIFLFIDLKDSTSLAEQTTPQAFFQYLNDFIYLCEEVIKVHGGIIYKYVGDSIIVVWDENKKNLKDSYQCMKEMIWHLKRNRGHFQRTYQASLAFTMGIHSGPTIIGEIGSEKKELGYLSDTINTAQRIQSKNKELETAYLLSGHYVERLKQYHITDDGDELVKYPAINLPGKDNLLDLYSYGEGAGE